MCVFSNVLGRKDALARVLQKMESKYGQQLYNVSPPAFVLPAQRMLWLQYIKNTKNHSNQMTRTKCASDSQLLNVSSHSKMKNAKTLSHRSFNASEILLNDSAKHGKNEFYALS